jgi:phage terminase Nu1 subunit (DNA packaging protein)
MEIIGFAGLVSVFGDTHRVWKRRVEAGMPVAHDPGERTGLARRFDSVAVHRWLLEQETGSSASLNPQQERARLDATNRQIRELELGVRRAELVDMAVVEKVWSGMTGAARQRLLGLPNRLASETAHQEFAVIYSRAEEIVHESLNELHQFDPRDYQ